MESQRVRSGAGGPLTISSATTPVLDEHVKLLQVGA